MPDNRRTPLLAYVLAIPVLAAVYVSTFGTRIWAALRPTIATFLGATVIGGVYADAAIRRAPATPLRSAAVLALAVALVGPGMAPAPAFAGGDDPAGAVISAFRSYIGSPYKLGAEGPDRFDCSGLVFRAFADAGELPRIGGMRLLARGYLRWFTARGRFTKDEDKARPGDLIVWNDGEHIGIYVGDSRAISALVNPYGITNHSIYGIGQRVTQVLLVNWGNGSDPDPEDPGEPEDPGDPGDPDNGGPGGGGDKGGKGPEPTAEPTATPEPDPTATPEPEPEPTATPEPDPTPDPTDNPGTQPSDPPDGVEAGNAGDNSGASTGGVGPRANSYGPPPAETPSPVPDTQPDGSLNAYVTGTLNMRLAADPTSRIVGWLGRGMRIRVISSATSASGYLWHEVETVSGKQGWVFAHWVRPV